MSAPVLGYVDGEYRLIKADVRLEELNQSAGGAPGGMLLIPPLLALVNLTRELGVPLSRSVIVADGEDDADLWVDTHIENGNVVIKISEWKLRNAREPKFEDEIDQRLSRAVSTAAIVWACDGDLSLTQLAIRDPRLPDIVAGKPQAFVDAFRLLADGEGRLAMINAVSDNRGFERQCATLIGYPEILLELSGIPNSGKGMDFDGFTGVASVSSLPDKPVEVNNQAKSLIGDAFAERLETALRQPLGRIIANAETIRTQFDGPMLPGYLDYAGDIANAGRHLLGLLDDLVDLEYIERHDFKYISEAVELGDAARRAAGLLGVKALEQNIRLELPPQDSKFLANAEFRRVLQILVNLIGNAIRHSPEGGTIRMVALRGTGVVSLTIADQGGGIAPEDHDRAFAKFERIDPQDTAGSGLGLYIARRLARAMHGDITVESRLGQGARFTLTLPAHV